MRASHTWIAAFLLIFVSAAQAKVTYPSRPPERGFIVDEAGLIDAADELTIVEVCDALLCDKKIPIIVCTIPSMKKYGSPGPVERYAAGLFNRWGIGFPDYNYGVLLLVAQNDRKARIELGADWSQGHDAVCRRIMDEIIVPDFRRGDFSTGIREGVEALDKMARGEDVPFPSWTERAGDKTRGVLRFMLHHLAWIVLLPVIILGRIFYPHVFRRPPGGGSRGGGSFGGGFSGGGGASGSW